MNAAAQPWLTWLYVPGDRPGVVTKALDAGSDVVLVDLEDAVPADRKSYARDAVRDLFAEPAAGGPAVHVRVNALDGPRWRDDVTAVAALPGVSGLRLPKVADPAAVRQVAALAAEVRGTLPPAGLYPLLESALGMENAYAVATAHPRVAGIALGEADLGADLGVPPDPGLDWCRSRLVVAARAAGLPAPAQSVYPDVRDLDGLARSCERGRALGLLGRTAIHPRQLGTIVRAYLPTEQEIERAAEVVAAAREVEGALALPDGRFVDAAVVEGARRVLALADRVAA
ncbi:HpcH/HpaI aldolase/citrate lyase family protein [Streptantibioticus silvisoli]|uniref:CoA ester lyase n=1 Tax=Streptantibioticus silvisoli TaxID=2705255 RepID=A0ABT6VT98_9ACTN|nr:CoA ester lyase [Streptantibioticus silvisoli]MDI5961706.1 CoA ester lyase [Streptantibioticus silvisoli]